MNTHERVPLCVILSGVCGAKNPESSVRKASTIERRARSVAPDLLTSVQPFGQIDRIAQPDLLGIDLVGPHLEPGHHGRPVRTGEGAFDCVQPMRDLYPANPGFVVAGVEDVPLTT